MVLSRRTFAKLVGATPAISSCYSAPSETLRAAGAKKNLLIGSAVSFRQLERPDYTTLLREQASILVSENDMKWLATDSSGARALRLRSFGCSGGVRSQKRSKGKRT